MSGFYNIKTQGDYNVDIDTNNELIPFLGIQRVTPKLGLALFNNTGALQGAICLEFNASKLSTSHIHLIEVDRDTNTSVGLAHNEYKIDIQGAAPYPSFAMRGSKILVEGFRPRDVKIYYEPNGNFNGTVRIYIGELSDNHQSPSYIFMEKVYSYVNAPGILKNTDFNLYLESNSFKGNLITQDILKVIRTYN